MNKRFVSVLMFALVVSAGASLVIYRLIVGKFVANAKPSTAQVMVASHKLEIGAMIRELDIKPADWSGPVPPQAVLKKDEKDLVGRGVIANIYPDEPILDSRLAPKGAGAGLAATIPKGMRAVAVRVNEVVGVAGFVVPGMRVDILISGVPPGGSNNLGTLTRTILQNIEVLSAGQNIQKDAEGKPVTVQVVNLLVSPEQAETLSLASNDTRIQLVLRNPLDNDEAKTPGTALATLFGRHVAPPAAPARSKPRTTLMARAKPAPLPVPLAALTPVKVPVVMEVIHGGKKTEAKFENGEGRE